MADFTIVQFVAGQPFKDATTAPTEIIAQLDVPIVPRQGETVNVKGKDWIVQSVFWAIDGISKPFERTLRAIVYINPTTKKVKN